MTHFISNSPRKEEIVALKGYLNSYIINMALHCFVWISSQCPHKNQCGLELKII